MEAKSSGLAFDPHAFGLVVCPKNEKVSWVIIPLFDAPGFDDAIFISHMGLYQRTSSFVTDRLLKV